MIDDIPYTTAGEFLELFGIDRSKRGAKDFEELVRRAALLRRFPDLGINCYQVALYDMSSRHNSPLVYWSNMKRAILPALEADRETLTALLGFSIPGDGEVSVYALASALSGSLALLQADWYRRLEEAHSREERSDDLQLPVVLAQEADREEAVTLAAAIKKNARTGARKGKKV